MSKKIYISRNYKHSHCAGSIAKRDIEMVLDDLGFKNVGLERSFYSNGIVHGVRNYVSMLKGMASIGKGDVVLLQYPMKIFYDGICAIAKRRGARVISLLIDLAAFREKEITPEQEIEKLNKSDVVLTHNLNMRRWLERHGCTSKLIDYEIMDYIHGDSGKPHRVADRNYSLFYVGNLTVEANGFLYELARLMPHRQIYLYGKKIEDESVTSLPNVHFEGMAVDTELMQNHKGDFGISWYGTGIDTGIGKYGEYMNVNNPHKVSLYMRCNAPVVLWHKAGRAEFIEREGLGISVDSLTELDQKLSALSEEDYDRMLANVERVNHKIKHGIFLKEAIDQALDYLATLHLPR